MVSYFIRILFIFNKKRRKESIPIPEISWHAFKLKV